METGWYSTTIPLDGRDLAISVKRLTVAENIAFDRDMSMLQRITNRQALALRQWRRRLEAVDPSEAPAVEWKEAPARDTPEFATYAEQVAARAAWEGTRNTDAIALRDLEESDAERTKRESLEAQDDTFATRFLTQAISTYVRVDAGQLDLDGEPVTTGGQLLAKYGARPEALGGVVGVISAENKLPEEIKKKLRSRSGSAPSSTAPTPQASGDAPATTAPSVSSSGSASAADATA